MTRTCAEIRSDFLAFFQQRGHTLVPSSPLLPADDPTLLFANAGMNQFKEIFLGRESRDYVRAANSQKCIRAGGKHNDLEDVGHDIYHHTFFEMLGNWSFGDYFKAEAIAWAWELLTGVWQLPKDRLYATVFGGDESEGLQPDAEAEKIWADVTDIDPAHILHGGKKDNFWEMGPTGPCGPCSEIHIDLTADGTGGKLVNAGDAHAIELWNLVFIQFNRAADGELTPLPARHVDTGMGLERIGMVLQGKRSNYATDLFVPIIKEIEKLTDHRYGSSSGLADRFDVGGEDDISDVACRVIADHARALTFAIADGVIPSNEGRGYVLRRILRRAARYGRQYLKIDGQFLVRLVPTIVDMMGEAFGRLCDRQEYVIETIRGEEESFGRTLDRGIELFERTVRREVKQSILTKYPAAQFHEDIPTTAGPDIDLAFKVPTRKPLQTVQKHSLRADLEDLGCQVPVVSGKTAFELYATYGFPVDLTQIMAAERGMSVDMDGFDKEMTEHQALSRAGSTRAAELLADYDHTPAGGTKFVGYEQLECETIVTGTAKLVRDEDGKQLAVGSALTEGDEGVVFLLESPFYAEGGGQIGDAGCIEQESGVFTVLNTVEVIPAPGIKCRCHLGKVASGEIEPRVSGARLKKWGDLSPPPPPTKFTGHARAVVDKAGRMDTMRNHTATHLLNWALREVLGDGVNQAGSVVSPDRLRFDFTHNQALTPEQLAEAERMVNERILADEPVVARTMPLAEAGKLPGVRAVFGEKYPDPVRVMMIGPDAGDAGDAGAEFCGGTHLQRTGQAGLFKILGEESVAKGVRRITAVTGRAAVAHVQEADAVVKAASAALRAPACELVDRITALQKEVKQLRKRPAGGSGGPEAFETVATIATPAGEALVVRVGHTDAGAMRSLCDVQRQKGFAAMFVGGADGGKVMLVAMVSEELIGQSKVHAGQWVKAVAPVVGGGGGGKPALAQAGGKQGDKLPDALQAAAKWLTETLT